MQFIPLTKQYFIQQYIFQFQSFTIPMSRLQAVPQQKQQMAQMDQHKANSKSRVKLGPNKSIKLVIVFVVSAILVSSLLNLYYFIRYVQVSARIKNNEKVGPRELLDILSFLSRYSIVFSDTFSQQLIFELGKAKQWNWLISQADKALRNENNKQKFSIYYHKAIGLCFTERYWECKSAIEMAHVYCKTKQRFEYVQNVYKILVSNNIISYAEVPTGVEFEAPKMGPTAIKKQSVEYYSNHLQGI